MRRAHLISRSIVRTISMEHALRRARHTAATNKTYAVHPMAVACKAEITRQGINSAGMRADETPRRKPGCERMRQSVANRPYASYTGVITYLWAEGHRPRCFECSEHIT